MATKSNLNKLLNSYATEERKAKAAWRKAIMKLHPNKGGNTAYFQEMSHLYNKYYKGNNTARIPNTLRRPSPPRRPSPSRRPSTWTPPPPPTRVNVKIAMRHLRRGDIILNGIRYKVYAWPKDSGLQHIRSAQSTFRKIIPRINTNAYSFKYPTDPLRFHRGVKNGIAVNRAFNEYFSKHH
jgi:curved DNA-binding protein CbpA